MTKFNCLILATALGATPAVARETLVLVERADHETTLHRIQGKDSLGDLIVFKNSVFDADNRIQIGQDQGFAYA